MDSFDVLLIFPFMIFSIPIFSTELKKKYVFNDECHEILFAKVPLYILYISCPILFVSLITLLNSDGANISLVIAFFSYFLSLFLCKKYEATVYIAILFSYLFTIRGFALALKSIGCIFKLVF